ncbi:MAG: hypothetical protein L6R37_000770 [Teloschistes peruensis]|nr:MAG: hypothetical protein L6R37_000770 [Teloschistes peruensis]
MSILYAQCSPFAKVVVVSLQVTMSALEYRALQLHSQRRPPPEQHLALLLRNQVLYPIVRASAQVAKLQAYILKGKALYKVKDGDQCGTIVSSYGTFSLADLHTNHKIHNQHHEDHLQDTNANAQGPTTATAGYRVKLQQVLSG